MHSATVTAHNVFISNQELSFSFAMIINDQKYVLKERQSLEINNVMVLSSFFDI